MGRISKSSLYLFLLLIFACSRKDSGDPNNGRDTTSPVITIVSPLNNQKFTAGQNIQVSAIATDNLKVTLLHIHVLNKTTEAILRDVHAYPDNKTGTVQDSFVAQAGLTYIIKVTAFDAAQNPATAQVDISVD